MSSGIITLAIDKAHSLGNHLLDLYTETSETVTQFENNLLQCLPKKTLTILSGIVTGVVTDAFTQNALDACHVDNPFMSRLAGPIIGSLVGYMIDNLKDPEDGEAPQQTWRMQYA